MSAPKKKTFLMLESLFLNSTGRTRQMNTRFETDNEKEEAELMSFLGTSVKLIKSKKPKKDESTTDDAKGTEGGAAGSSDTDDLDAIPGIGAASIAKLAELTPPVGTPEQLKEFVQGSPEEARELLGKATFENVTAHFEKAASGNDTNEGGAASSREGGDQK